MDTSRVISIEDEDEFKAQLQRKFDEDGLDYDAEQFWDVEFNRVFIAYMYPNVTYAN